MGAAPLTAGGRASGRAGAPAAVAPGHQGWTGGRAITRGPLPTAPTWAAAAPAHRRRPCAAAQTRVSLPRACCAADLERLWEAHMATEFSEKSAASAVATMVPNVSGASEGLPHAAPGGRRPRRRPRQKAFRGACRPTAPATCCCCCCCSCVTSPPCPHPPPGSPR